MGSEVAIHGADGGNVVPGDKDASLAMNYRVFLTYLFLYLLLLLLLL